MKKKKVIFVTNVSYYFPTASSLKCAMCFVCYDVKGFACIVTLLILFSTNGLYVLGFTGSFSSSSSASNPSMTRPVIIQKRNIHKTNHNDEFNFHL